MSLRFAEQLVRDHPHPELKSLHACVLHCKKTFYVGFNRPKTHPLQKEFGRNEHSIFLHAEMDAIVQALRNNDDFSGSSIYVARLYKNGKVAPSKPCSGCQDALDHFGILNVYHT